MVYLNHAQKALRASLVYLRANPCPHTLPIHTRHACSLSSQGIQRYKVESFLYVCMCACVWVCVYVENVHLIIKKTVIQARKLGRGAARS